MASISSIMGSSSSTSSIYGSRNTNIISGLASGMDTESMIEGMVQSYQQKIISLQQSKTSSSGSKVPIRAFRINWLSFPENTALTALQPT